MSALSACGRGARLSGCQRPPMISSQIMAPSRTAPPRRPIAAAAHTPRTVPDAATPQKPETAKEALQRRKRESEEVMTRIENVYSVEDLNSQLERAGGKLVVLEVVSDSVCETGLEEEAEVQWRRSQEEVMRPCNNVKHVFQRTARNCKDVIFLEHIAVPDDKQSEFLCKQLGTTSIPALYFFKEDQLVWRQEGYLGLEQNLGEGVLYYGDALADGRASDHVADLHSVEEVRAWVASQPADTLACVNVAMTSETCCVRVYPAMLALAKNFKGYCHFARIIADENEQTRPILRDLNVIDIPSFIFFRGGREVHRYAGSSRGDLLGQVLSLSPVVPPPPPGQVGRGRAKRQS